MLPLFLLECLLVNGKGDIHFAFRFVSMLKCDIEC